MITDQITEENIDRYSDVIPADIAENISRTTYFGLAVQRREEDPLAAMIWRLKDFEVDDRDTNSYVSFLRAEDLDAGEALFSEYSDMINKTGAKKLLQWESLPY